MPNVLKNHQKITLGEERKACCTVCVFVVEPNIMLVVESK